jgi:hypothetical protein
MRKVESVPDQFRLIEFILSSPASVDIGRARVNIHDQTCRVMPRNAHVIKTIPREAAGRLERK